MGIAATAAWGIAFLGWRTSPASFDFIALYASARLVATGQAALVTDRDAILAVENATRPERTAFLNNPNPPAVSALLAPLGLLPFDVAYPAMLTLLVASLIASARLLAGLPVPGERPWLFAATLLAPPSLIALVQGQTTPLILLAVAGSLRAGPRWSGALLAATALRPQLLPLFALVALADRERRVPFVAGVTGVVAASLAVIGPSGVGGYLDLVGRSAAELRPGDLGVASLLRRAGGGEDALLSLTLSALALLAGAAVVLRAPRERRIAIASSWSIFAAPHALPHDGVVSYPAVADAARSRAAARAWAASGVAVSVIQIAGLPVASLWLLALSLWTARAPAGPTRR